jgi:hypothetical protein
MGIPVRILANIGARPNVGNKCETEAYTTYVIANYTSHLSIFIFNRLKTTLLVREQCGDSMARNDYLGPGNFFGSGEVRR